MVPFKDFIGLCATLCTIAVFFSGCFTCRQMWTQKSPEGISAFPFIAGFLNCFLWLKYGLYSSDNILIGLNGLGLMLHLIYIGFYSYFIYATVQKSRFMQMLCFTMFLLALLHFGPDFVTTSMEISKNFYGLLASGAVVMFVASPLTNVPHIIRTKSSDNLPTPMIILSFIMAILWSWYGMLEEDVYIMVPNALGVLFTLVQVILIIIYPKTNFVYAPLLKPASPKIFM